MLPEKSSNIYEKELVKINDIVPNINKGGCAFFALALYKKLDTSRYEIVKIGNFIHVCIRDKVDGFFIDSDGFNTEYYQYLMCLPSFLFKNKSLKITVISYDELYNIFYYTNRKWNPEFNMNDTSKIKSFLN